MMELGLTPWHFADRSAAGLSAQAVLAESLGYRSFWLPENHFNPAAIPDPLMLLAAVAAATTRLRLATTSYLLPLRNPLLAAEQVAVLDQLSNGRTLLGIGRGYSNETLRAFGIDPGEKRERFAWSLDLMRRAWRGEPIAVNEGDTPVTVAPRPVQTPHPPLWLAAFGAKALTQAGQLGLPYLAAPIDTFAQLALNYARFDEAVAAAGHAPVTIRPIMRTVFVSDDETSLRDVRARLANLALPRRLKVPEKPDDWAIVGRPALVRERLLACRESLSVTHLVVTHLRLENLAPEALRDSVTAIAEVVAVGDQASAPHELRVDDGVSNPSGPIK